nr:hypothetical protein Iba_chr10cCG12270 [Ipomoea batatas]
MSLCVLVYLLHGLIGRASASTIPYSIWYSTFLMRRGMALLILRNSSTPSMCSTPILRLKRKSILPFGFMI